MHSLLSQFPGTPRQTQVEALNKIEKAVANNKKYIIVCAPTGSGKSHIGASIALSGKNSPQGFVDMVDDLSLFDKDETGCGYINAEHAINYGKHRSMVCTVTKALQDQYTGLFPYDCVMFKGKSNYMCDVDNNLDCEAAPCVTDPSLKRQCQMGRKCKYYNARNSALVNKFSVMNYNAFMCLPEHTRQIEYLVCDEASELEDAIADHYTVNIAYTQLASALAILNIDKLTSERVTDGYAWLKNLNEQLKSEQERFASRLSKSKTNKKKLSQEISNYKYIKCLSDTIGLLLSNWYMTEIVIECKPDNVTFTPLNVNNLAEAIFSCAQTVILMSATIIDPPNFARRLGIKDYEYIEIDNTFDPKKSPIYCKVAKFNLNYANIDTNLPKVIEQVDKICEHYVDKKGVIHTHSFKITEKIQNTFKRNKRFIYREPGLNNERLIKMHTGRPDASVMVSPSLTFGTDLPDDLGRFQVIVKLPYPSLGSKKVKTLFERDKSWYSAKMLNELVQACGRCTRHIEDYSDTFILDGQILQVLKMNWGKLPQSFKDRIH